MRDAGPSSDTGRKLWIVQRKVGLRSKDYPDGLAYLCVVGGKWGPKDIAAAWSNKEGAEEAAARMILSDPEIYFGDVDVVEVSG